jgi:hypothetical protein
MSTPTDHATLTEQFIQHGIYLRDWSPQTVSTYRLAFRDCPDVITKPNLNAGVVATRGRGLNAGGINLRARAINSFLTWLHEEGHLPERLIEYLCVRDIRRSAA